MKRFVAPMLLALALAVAGASGAAARECKSEAVTATGAASATQLVAYPSSLLEWRNAVKAKYGAEFNSWRYADKRDIKCDKNKDGKWVCTRTALPCKDVLSTVVEGEAGQPKKECKSESLTSYGTRKATEDAATEEAKSGWRIDAQKKYSKEWAKWDNASEADIDCRKVGSKQQCIAVAVPCKSM